MATSAADVDRAARDGRTVVLLGCEGGDFLDGDLRRLEEARMAGVTVLTLVHYRVNEIGDVQTEPPVHGGLSRFGRAVVAECSRLGIVVDCAHASFATTMAVLEVSGQPVIISHGQLGHAGTTHPRLLTTAHVAAVASAGGLIGAWPAGLTSQSLADFAAEIIRLTDAAGPAHVGIGTDLDGNYQPVLTSYCRSFPTWPGCCATAGLRRTASSRSSAATPQTCSTGPSPERHTHRLRAPGRANARCPSGPAAAADRAQPVPAPGERARSPGP